MAKRHMMIRGSWESIIGRLEELVLANSGEDYFEEIFKIFVAKLYSERMPNCRQYFSANQGPKDTATNINLLLAKAAERWRGIIHGIPRSKLTYEHLHICIEAIQGHDLSDSGLEVMDGLFEFLVSRAAKGAKGQYFTPRHVIECCVRIINPGPNETIVDPACGSGGFLIHSINHIRSQRKTKDTKKYCERNVWGFDYDRRAIQVAKALMLIVGDGYSNLFQLNSLIQDEAGGLFSEKHTNDENHIPQVRIEDVMRSRVRGFKGFDIVMTNPPFAGEILEQDLLHSYQLYRRGRRMERDVLFLERCVRLLKPGGRMAIVIPHNKLAAKTWGYLRKWLVRHIRIVGVLGLHRNTFLPHTHQKACVVFGLKRKEVGLKDMTEPILFMISEKSGKDSTGQIVDRPEADSDLSVWERADHDLDRVQSDADQFINTLPCIWSKS